MITGGLGTLAAARIVDLAQPLETGMPCSPSHPGFRMALLHRHGDDVDSFGGSGANELIMTGGHVGTHIDALCHVSLDNRLHGGWEATAASPGGRFAVHGVETVAPFLCRGVLADIPALHGIPRLEPGYGITAEDLRAALDGTRAGPGEVVLVRTGWPQLYGEPGAYLGRDTGVPGITGEAAEYLAGLGVRAVGSDTIATDRIPPGVARPVLAAHLTLLVEHGIHLLEVLDLEELAAMEPIEFLFVAIPLKITGATGSPVRPLAVLPPKREEKESQ
ncbi:cyclase family protein [Sciscionella sediminilitoris]|uniref:cyclase family protein n=1 Tax=Sciscionella sediminilitoris TaxID=1445613 RepID=UPI0004DFC70C|nr:cyclase family protein [Sciscionella sp. SE31]